MVQKRRLVVLSESRAARASPGCRTHRAVAGTDGGLLRSYFIFGAGVPAPGGLSGAVEDGAEGGVEELSSVGGLPLSGVVLPVVELPDGSVGGGVEPPHAQSQMTDANERPEAIARFMVFSLLTRRPALRDSTRS